MNKRVRKVKFCKIDTESSDFEYEVNKLLDEIQKDGCKIIKTSYMGLAGNIRVVIDYLQNESFKNHRSEDEKGVH